MAEIGRWTPAFCSHCPQVSRAVLPRYRSRFSKHQFNQPQLLAILCLMRYEDWTFRDAEVRLGEHRELRQTLGLVSVPDFTTLYRFLQRGSRRDGASPARCAAPKPPTGSRGGRCDGPDARSRQYVLCAADASS